MREYKKFSDIVLVSGFFLLSCLCGWLVIELSVWLFNKISLAWF